MNGYNFTERVRLVLANARREAARLNHEYVGTEHILLSIVHSDSGVAATVLDSFSVDPSDIGAKVDAIVKKGLVPGDYPPDLPYTSRAKKVLELAMAEARALHHSYVGTEHLLLGLIREEKGIAAQVLAEFGIGLDATRARMLEILGQELADEETYRRIHGDALVWPSATSDDAAASASGRMAASIIESLIQDAGVARVFLAQGINVAKLTAALRSYSRVAPDAPPPLEPPADTPPA